ncbi:hypothetical protein [Streptomyces sp. NPDC005799]|uniref:hypothetical protein n=1 Tax=Streptomyces sp. NPDC005799 TaxID=3154678 RepID=UPI0033D3A22E
MTASRVDVILRVLRAEQPVRPLFAYELGESLVQLLGPHSSDPTWQAPPGLLAASIDAALTRAEEKDISADTSVGGGTAFTPHALVLELDGPDFRATCRCGQPIGRTPQDRPVDGLVGLWEQHATRADPDAAWADALTSLHPTSIGAS